MNEHVTIAPVRKTVHVKVPVAHAFDVFTTGLTRWWPHDHGVGKKPIQKVLMEPRLGGRWLEISEDGTETSVATIKLWEPPHLLCDGLAGQRCMEAGRRDEIRGRCALCRRRSGSDACRAAAPQVRDHGAGSGRFDAETMSTAAGRA